ncbi:hypothetical protein PFISCL1PPCAC_28214, partial [Pristionchus fissidentatus]
IAATRNFNMQQNYAQMTPPNIVPQPRVAISSTPRGAVILPNRPVPVGIALGAPKRSGQSSDTNSPPPKTARRGDQKK